MITNTVMTRGAARELLIAGESVTAYLSRHFAGDWGDLPMEDEQANLDALARDERIISAYRLRTGARIWIITDAGHRTSPETTVTTVLLPEEY